MSTAMFLAFLYTAVFLDGTQASCPSSSQMLPCKCLYDSYSLYVSCTRTLLDQIEGPLAAIAKTKQPVSELSLQHVQLPNLPSYLLVGFDVQQIEIKECYTSTIHEYAFVDVAAKLRGLVIRGNPLEEVPCHALKILSNLESLNLEDNRIQVLPARAFKGLDSLLLLSLNGNRIKVIDDTAFEGIGSKFRMLHLSRNKLTSVPEKPLSNLSSLEDLRLANNTIRGFPARVFKSLKKLRSLDLSRNVIKSIHPFAFKGNEDTLRDLFLGYNQFKEVPIESLKNLSQLIQIDLRGNNICKVRKDDFLPYGKSLVFIYLQNNLLKYVDSAAFTHLDALRVLSLQSNKLTSASFKTYSPIIDTLEQFDIHDNPLHCDCRLSWLLYWIRGNGSKIVQQTSKTKCSTPKRHSNMSVAEISTYELVCENWTSESPEPCCDCINSAPECLHSNWFLTLSKLGITYLLYFYGMSRLLK